MTSQADLIGPWGPSLCLIAISEHPIAAVQPMCSVMSNYKISEKFSLNIPTWQYMPDLCLSALS